MEAPAATRRTRRYYGWTMIGVTGVAAAATSPGQSYLLGLFNTPLREAAGVDVSGLSLAYMIGTFGSATLLTYVGHWSDQRGPRKLAAIAALGLGLACAWFASGLAVGLITLTIGFFLLRFFGQGCLNLASTHALALWWERRLGRAESLRLGIFAAAMMVLPPIMVTVIGQLGYRGAFAVMGATVWLLILPMVWLLWRNTPADVGQAFGDPADHTVEQPDAAAAMTAGLTLPQSLRCYPYWAQASVNAYFAAVGTAMMFHARPILESAGHDQAKAAALAATCITTWAGVNFAFHFIGGVLVDKLRAGVLLALVAAGLGLAALLAAVAATSSVYAIAAFAMLGAAQGTIMTSGSPIVVRHFGRRSLGAVKGSFSTIGVAASGAGPALVALVADAAGGAADPRFSVALWACAAVAVPLVVGALLIRKPAWDRCEA